jgi:predicted nucleotidyltransferase
MELKVGTPDGEKLSAILGELRGRLEQLSGSRLSRILRYGSQARGDAGSGSDIDVSIVLHGSVNPGEEIRRTSEMVADLSLKHGEDISRQFMSEDAYELGANPLALNVHREGVPLR